MSKKKQAASKPGPIRWEFDADVPTDDFFDGRNLDELWDLQEAVDNFVSMMDGDTFQAWEAVMCEEQDLPLTAKQKKALGKLLSFNDEEDDEILYIDEIPRPNEPWYVILGKIASHLLIEPYRTFDCHDEVKCDGWNRIATALREHGQGLSLPPGVESPEEVVPAELRHKLWLQWCFNDLSGLGQDEEATLENPDEQDRVDNFIENLRECNDCIAYFGLTLDSLLTKVVLPKNDRPVFIKLMQEKLGMSSTQEPIAARL